MTPPPERDIDPFTGAELELSGSKKRSSEEATEYPRRRATIAVGLINSLYAEIDKLRLFDSARYAGYARHDATEPVQNASSAPISTPSVCTESQESSSMLVTS